MLTTVELGLGLALDESVPDTLDGVVADTL